MLVKVCGMRDPDNIRAVAALGIDLMGFIFWEKSPRKALPQTFAYGRGKGAFPFSTFNSQFEKVGVFVDEQPQHIMAKVDEYHLDYIQLHGNESAAYIDHLRSLTTAKIIKAISIHDADDVERWRTYDTFSSTGSGRHNNRNVDMLLFDTKCKCVGGSGEQFDWSVLEAYDGDIPFLLSGGIGPDDAERVKAFYHPRCIGIDLNSKFEDAPGLKNIEKLKQFILSLRQNSK